MIASSGYQSAFFYFGIGQGVIVFLLAFFIRRPLVAQPAKKKQLNLPQTKIDFTPPQVLRSPIFWVMYAVFVMVAAGGLMTAAQIAPIAHDYKIANTPVSLAGFQMAALTFAISLDRIFDGFGRPFFGWVSDNIGREHTMFIAFGTAALMLLTLSAYGHNPIVFVLATAVYFGVFGEIYSLFPATSGDTFGVKYATTNNGMLYTAKGTASLLVPLASHRRRQLRLAGGVRDRGWPQRHRGPDGAVRDQADAARLHPGQRNRRRASRGEQGQGRLSAIRSRSKRRTPVRLFFCPQPQGIQNTMMCFYGLKEVENTATRPRTVSITAVK